VFACKTCRLGAWSPRTRPNSAAMVSAYRAGSLRGHEATPGRAAGDRNLRDFSHAKPIQTGRNETRSLILMSAFGVNVEVRARPKGSAGANALRACEGRGAAAPGLPLPATLRHSRRYSARHAPTAQCLDPIDHDLGRRAAQSLRPRTPRPCIPVGRSRCANLGPSTKRYSGI
jgi:hypothetical protein